MVEFTEPKILRGNVWAVYFRAVNPDTGERKLFKFEAGLNIKQHKTERLRRANTLRQYLHERLKQGWNPFQKTAKPSKENTLQDYLDEMINIKRSSMKPKSIRNYNDIAKGFKSWLTENSLAKIPAHKFTAQHMRAYSDYLLTQKHYAGKTHNNYIGILRALFSEMLEREIITLNPADKIKNRRVDTGKNFPFTDEEKTRLINHMKAACPHFFLACCFTYYCFLRRSELIELRFQDIDLEKKSIIIHSKGAKGRTQQSVTIPVQFEQMLRDYKIDTYQKDLYVFGRRCCPNKTKLKKPDYYSYRFRMIADSLGVDKQKGYYAWKHTGVCALYKSMKKPDVNIIRIQCRHSDIRTTMIYLRSLGLDVQEQIRETDFRI